MVTADDICGLRHDTFKTSYISQFCITVYFNDLILLENGIYTYKYCFIWGTLDIYIWIQAKLFLNVDRIGILEALRFRIISMYIFWLDAPWIFA